MQSACRKKGRQLVRNPKRGFGASKLLNHIKNDTYFFLHWQKYYMIWKIHHFEIRYFFHIGKKLTYFSKILMTLQREMLLITFEKHSLLKKRFFFQNMKLIIHYDFITEDSSQ